MFTPCTNLLKNGPLFRDEQGVVHTHQDSASWTPCVIVDIDNFGYMSAIREIGLLELDDNCGFTKPEYDALAHELEVTADAAGGEFGKAYREVARLIREYANRL